MTVEIFQIKKQREMIAIFSIFLLCILSSLSFAQMYISPNTTVWLSPNCVLTINTDLTISSNATLTQSGFGTIYISRNWINNGTFNSGNGLVVFYAATNSSISGSSATTFYDLQVNKTGSAIVLLDGNVTVNDTLLVANGILRFGNSQFLKMIVNGNVFVANGGIFDVINTLPSGLDSLKIKGNLTVNGTVDFNLSNGKVFTFFINSGDGNIDGTGTISLYELIMDKPSRSDTVRLKRNINVPDGFLTLNGGTFKVEGNFNFTNTFLKPYLSNIYIQENAGLFIDNANVTINGQPTAGDLYLRGSLYLNKGQMNVGTTGESSIIYDNSPPNFSELVVNNAILNVRTRLSPASYGTNLINYTQTAGTVRIGYGSQSTNPSVGMFDISANGSSFNWSGGTIELNSPANNTVADYVVLATNGTVSGGLLKVDAISSGFTFDLNTTKPVYEFQMTGTNNPNVRLLSNDLTVVTNITFAGSGNGLFNTNNRNITIGGNWINNFASNDGFNPTTGTVTFNGSTTQNIGGSQSTNFYNLSINKTGGAVELNISAKVDNNLRLISSTIFDLNSNDLTIGANGNIYSDNGNQDDLSTFNANKCLINSGSGGNPLLGARLIRRISSSATLPLNLKFPIGTPNAYSPAEIIYNIGGASFGTNAYVSVKPVPNEHPAIEVSNKSLAKYWVLDDNDISYSNDGTTVRFYYNSSEVQGSEGNYVVLYYAPSYNDPNGYWRSNPGINNYVDYNNHLFFSQQVDSVRGDWTVGEPDAAFPTFFARADGDFNDPNTWSNIYFNGTPASSYPSKRNHKVRIQDHSVTISNDIPTLNLISVENGTEGRQSGVLVFTSNYIVGGDTFRMEQNAKLKISHSDGISALPSNTGCIRTSVRDLSSFAIYEFVGTGAQITGDGIPNSVRGFVVTKPSGQTLTLSKNIQIIDSLVINDGVLDISTYSINGQASGKTMIMRGGEMIVRQSFPTNYNPPTFSAGRITFDGSGNVTIPSSNSSPGVLQYYDLKISGSPRAGNVLFPSVGEIRINNQLEISSLNFANNTYRFLTNGSTVRFNKNGGTQTVPLKPASPSDTVVFLEYYNLILDSAGTKILTASGSPTFKVLNNLTIDNNATFNANNFNLEVQGNWTNLNGSVFVPGSGTVIFRNPNSSTTTTITSRDTTDNPFNNVLIAGAGTIQPNDNIKIQGNITISNGSTFKMTNNFLSLWGNWINQGGTFDYQNSTISFNGTSTQSISKISGDENFYNLIVKNQSGVDFYGVGSSDNGIIVHNDLTLNSGNIRARSGSNFRFVRVVGNLSRPGGGYVDAELQKNVGTGSTSVTFEVGFGSNYTPVVINIGGNDGTAGYVGVFSDTITTTSFPISWSDPTPTSILPAGSGMSPSKHVARQYSIRVPTGSSFSLGSNRKYSATFTFIGATAPNGDLRNGANISLFEARLRSGTNWIGPYFYGTYPFLGTRTTNTTEFDSLVDFGTFVVGEPDVLTFYTRADGNWTTATNWSTQGFGGNPASEYPGQNTNNFRAFIGNGNSITLDANITVSSVGSNVGWVQVDSSGTLDFGTNILTGTGEFRLAKDGTVITSNANGFRATGAFGSVQTSTRDYNYNSHNRAHIVYAGNSNQTQANEGIGPTVATLRINKTGGTLSFNRILTISDSLYLQQGSVTFGGNVTINGNIRRNSGTTFNAGTTTFIFTSSSGDTITNLDSNPLTFYNLTLSKLSGTGDVVLSQNTAIQISNNLTFNNSTGYKSLIDARSYAGTYVIISNGASVSNASNARGWVNGELRKWIPVGDAPAVLFEVGDSLLYSPFMIDFRGGTNNGTAGYLAVKVISGKHPYMDNAYNPPISPYRLIGPKWWRLTLPNGSTFQRGNRNFDPRAYFIVPEDAGDVDAWDCVDLTYLRRWTGNVDWQPLYPNSVVPNSGTGSYSCADTRDPSLTPNFTYSGALSGGLAYVNVANVNTAFGSTEYIGSDLLLGDFVAGNQNTIARFYTFYSVRDGDWTDPATWSTISLNDTINPTNAAASDVSEGRDRTIYGFPRRQYDNVIIGNGKKVRLDANIGTNRLSSVPQLNTLAGPSVTVLNSGILDLNYHVLRGNQFRILNGGKLIIGSASGITSGNSGNINLYPGASPSYSDSISVVYSCEGVTSDLATYLGTIPNRNGTVHYLERVRVLDASNNVLMDNVTLDTLTRSSQCINIYTHKKAVLTAGNSYYLQIDPAGTGNRRYRVWIDYNRNGSFTDAGELVINMTTPNTTLFNTPSFTVPAGTNPGSTHMRIGMRENTNNFSPTSNGTGEFEEYTIDIVNSNASVTQVTGNGLPRILRSFEVHSPRNGSQVQPTGTPITILDSIRIRSGQVNNASSVNFVVYGDFVVDTANGYNPFSETIYFANSGTSNIRGSASPITFNNVYFQKRAIDTINIKTRVTINGTMRFDSLNIVRLFDNQKITFGSNGNVSYTDQAFSNKKMIVVSGNSNTGTIEKQFANGNSVTRTFTYPVGIDTVFNMAYVSITGNFAIGSNLVLKLNSAQHPNRLNNYILKKYWTFQKTGISNVTASTYQFDFYGVDTVGNISRYIPGRYQSSSGWEINLGTSPNISTTSYGYRINITNDTTYNGSKIDGDWTAGEPNTFFTGRVFFSCITCGSPSLKWSNQLTWSNYSHTGPPSAYYPGQIYDFDTVNIDGMIVYFDVQKASVDSIRIGGTYSSSPTPGQIRFDVNSNNKVLSTRQLFIDNEAGAIHSQPTTILVDTLIITQNIINNATGIYGMNLFWQATSSDSHYVVLKFAGNGNSKITGNGPWGSIRSIVIEKNSLQDSVIVESAGLCNGTSSSSKHFFEFKKGILVQNLAGQNLYISGSETFPIAMGTNTGITVLNGSVFSRSTVTTNSNTFIHLKRGNFSILPGISPNASHLLYNTGTVVRIDTGELDIAKTFSRATANATVDFTLGPMGLVRVNSQNTGSYDSTRIGFDISNVGSTFSMSGGRIIVANALGTSPTSFDLRINAQNGPGMTGGVIQSGDSTFTPNGTIIKIGGSIPVFDLHFANNPSNAVTTQIAEQVFTISGNWTIDANHSFNLNGNTVQLGGNLANYGIFNGSPSGPTTDSWLIELNGSVDQTLFSNTSPIQTYNFRVNKSNGNVLLSTTGNSNLIINNTLEFTNSNNAFITAPIQAGKYVQISPITGSNPTIVRNGKGHINGRLYRYVENGLQIVFFPVGADTIDSFRPVWFLTYDNNNTAGLVGVVAFNFVHSDIADANVDTNKMVNRYWKVTTPPSGGFALGSGNTFGLKVQFLNPKDIRPSSDVNYFSMFNYNPPCPDPPTTCSGTGNWTQLTTPVKTDTTVLSTGNTLFGDFVVGEPLGIIFWSRNNGNWNDVNTWSWTSYYVDDVPSRIPNQPFDIVRIGNGRTVTIPNGFYPNVKSVYVEKDTANRLPGTLLINGSLGYLSGQSFVLEDSCTIGIQNQYGIARPVDGNIGAIQTATRNFGVSRYYYNSASTAMITGLGLPDTIKTLIINNAFVTNSSVYLSNYSGASAIKIQDTLLIQQGVFNAGNRNMILYKVMIIDSTSIDGRFEPTSSEVLFSGVGDKYIILRNRSGIRFNNLTINNGNVIISRPLINTNRQHTYVSSVLNFANPNTFITLLDTTHLIVTNSAVTAIQNYGSNRFVNTSLSSGMLIRSITAGQNYYFPVGSNGIYAPAIFEASATGTAGKIGIRTSYGQSTYQPNGHIGFSPSTSAVYLKRYWTIDSVTAQINGKWTFTYDDADVAGDETQFTKMGRWRPPFERTPGAWQFPIDPPSINIMTNTFEIPSSLSYSEIFGDWTIGNPSAFRRIFFSRQTGLWTNDQSWTYSPTHSGPIAGAGLYPNSPGDSVVVGGGNNGSNNHEITLNVSNPFSSQTDVGIAVGTGASNTGTLILGTNILNGQYFTLGDYSTIKIGSPDGITSIGTNLGNIQTTSSRNYNINGIYVYNGNTNQVIGNGLPATVYSFVVDNSGTYPNNVVTIDHDITVQKDLQILNGTLDLQTYSMNSVIAGTGTFEMANNTMLRVAGINDLALVISNYQNYNIATSSIVHFNGGNQIISNLPLNLTQDFSNNTGGLGNVWLSNSGTKFVNQPLLIRGNLVTYNGITLQNSLGVDALSVRGSVINNATIFNLGVIEIGICP